MRILDEDSDEAVQKVTLYLTRAEAKELRDSLDGLLALGHPGRHEHVPDETFSKEITVCLYDSGDVAAFNARSRKLILEDS